MNIALDDRYEQLASAFQLEQVRLLRESLSQNGITGDLAREICEKFIFDLGVLFDQGDLKVAGGLYRPHLMFSEDDSTCYANNGEVELHEMTFGTIEDSFSTAHPELR